MSSTSHNAAAGASTFEESHPLVNVSVSAPVVKHDDNGEQRKIDTDKVHRFVYFGELQPLRNFLAHEFKGSLHKLRDPDDGYTPLHYTTFSGPLSEPREGGGGGRDSRRKELAVALLDYARGRGESELEQLVNAVDGLRNTALHHAAQYKRFPLIHLLLENGGDSRAKRADGLTPLHLIADAKAKDSAGGRVIRSVLRAMLKMSTEDTELIQEMGQIGGRNGGEHLLNFLVSQHKLDLVRLGKDGCAVPQHVVVGKAEFTKEFWSNLLAATQSDGKFVAINSGLDNLAHVAARVAHVSILELMLDRNVVYDEKSFVNAVGETPFHCVVQNDSDDSVECLRILLALIGAQKLPRTQLSIILAKNNAGQTMISIASALRAAKPLHHILQHKIGGIPNPWIDNESLCTIYGSFPTALIPFMDDADQIRFEPFGGTGSKGSVHANFTYLLGCEESAAMTDTNPLQCVLAPNVPKEEQVQILHHPLVQLFLHRKARAFRHVAFVWFVLQLLLAVSYNRLATILYATTHSNNVTDTSGAASEDGHKKDDGVSQEWLTPSWEWILCLVPLTFITFIAVVKEFVQLAGRRRAYFCSPLNYFQVAYVGACALLLADGFTGTMRDKDWRVGVASFGCFLSTFFLLREMGQLRPFQRFYEVFVLVVKSSLKVLLFYAPCLLAFTFAFSILLKHNEVFALPYGFSKIFSMTIGELDYEKITDADQELTFFVQIMYLVFAFVASIVLINLLIAYAVSDLDSLTSDADHARLVSQLELVHSFEGVLRGLTSCKCQVLRRLIKEKFFLNERVQKMDAGELESTLYKRVRGLSNGGASTASKPEYEN